MSQFSFSLSFSISVHVLSQPNMAYTMFRTLINHLFRECVQVVFFNNYVRTSTRAVNHLQGGDNKNHIVMGWFLYVCQIFGTYSFWLNGNWTCPLLWQVLKRKQSWCVRFHIKPHYELEAPKQVASRKLKWRIKESWKNICSFVCCSNASPVLAKAFFFQKMF